MVYEVIRQLNFYSLLTHDCVSPLDSVLYCKIKVYHNAHNEYTLYGLYNFSPPLNFEHNKSRNELLGMFI